MKRIIFLLALICLLTPAFSTAKTAYAYINVDIGSVDEGDSIRDDGDDEKEITEHMNEFLNRYKSIIMGVYGMAVCTVLVIFIMLITKLPASAGNPMDRKKTITQILISGLSFAALGSIGLIATLVFNLFS